MDKLKNTSNKPLCDMTMNPLQTNWFPFCLLILRKRGNQTAQNEIISLLINKPYGCVALLLSRHTGG
jgi:hypothetical protein